MPIFNWKCSSCGELTRKLLKDRPTLGTCCCGGKLEFMSDLTTRVVEVRDNGLMPRKVEQLQGVQEMVRDRSTGSSDPGKV